MKIDHMSLIAAGKVLAGLDVSTVQHLLVNGEEVRDLSKARAAYARSLDLRAGKLGRTVDRSASWIGKKVASTEKKLEAKRASDGRVGKLLRSKAATRLQSFLSQDAEKIAGRADVDIIFTDGVSKSASVYVEDPRGSLALRRFSLGTLGAAIAMFLPLGDQVIYGTSASIAVVGMIAAKLRHNPALAKAWQRMAAKYGVLGIMIVPGSGIVTGTGAAATVCREINRVHTGNTARPSVAMMNNVGNEEPAATQAAA